MIENHVRWRLGHKFLIAEFAFEPAHFFILFFLLFHDSVERFLDIDIAGHGDSDGESLRDQFEQLGCRPMRLRCEVGGASAEMGKVFMNQMELLLPG